MWCSTSPQLLPGFLALGGKGLEGVKAILCVIDKTSCLPGEQNSKPNNRGPLLCIYVLPHLTFPKPSPSPPPPPPPPPTNPTGKLTDTSTEPTTPPPPTKGAGPKHKKRES